jgi:hypothetical protein
VSDYYAILELIALSDTSSFDGLYQKDDETTELNHTLASDIYLRDLEHPGGRMQEVRSDDQGDDFEVSLYLNARKTGGSRQ